MLKETLEHGQCFPNLQTSKVLAVKTLDLCSSAHAVGRAVSLIAESRHRNGEQVSNIDVIAA